jgi:regulatory protein
MQIVSIRKIKRNVQIIFDTGEELLLRYEVFIKSGLRKNDITDTDLIADLEKQNKIFSAKETAFNILSRRNHSVKELERKLLQRRIEKNIVNEIIIDLIKSNYLNDEKFAREFLDEKLRLKTIGLEKIKKELFAKGIHREVINEVLSEKGELDESENALLLVYKKMKFFERNTADARKLKQRIFSFLLSKGYNYDTIEKVMNKINSEVAED